MGLSEPNERWWRELINGHPACTGTRHSRPFRHWRRRGQDQQPFAGPLPAAEPTAHLKFQLEADPGRRLHVRDLDESIACQDWSPPPERPFVAQLQALSQPDRVHSNRMTSGLWT